jgi:glutamate dehydrogenase
VRAFAVVRDGFGLPALYREIDALDNKIDGQVQLDLYAAVGRLVLTASAWDLKNGDGTSPLGAQIAALQDARKQLEPKFSLLLPDFTRDRVAERKLALVAAGAPEKLADRLALLDVSALIPDIALVARDAKSDLIAAAKAFFAITDAFRISQVEDAAGSIATSDYYEGMALSRAIDTIGAARRGMAAAALGGHGKKGDPVSAWLEAGGERIGKTRERLMALTEGGDITVSRLTVASGLMSDLAGL